MIESKSRREQREKNEKEKEEQSYDLPPLEFYEEDAALPTTDDEAFEYFYGGYYDDPGIPFKMPIVVRRVIQ